MVQARGRPVSPELAADLVAVQSIRRAASAHRQLANMLIEYSHDAGISGRSVLAAMDGSGASGLDRLLTGVVFAVGRAANHPATAAVVDGRVRVRRAPDNVLGDLSAAYISQDLPSGLRKDTFYATSELWPNDLGHRGLIIHELQHAHQDGTGRLDPGQAPTGARAEFEAYRTQARYVTQQLLASRRSRDPNAATGAAIQAGGSLNAPLVVALAIELKGGGGDLALLREVLSYAPGDLGVGPRDADRLFALPVEELERRQASVLVRGYREAGIDLSTHAPFDGWAGHSAADIAVRTGQPATAAAAAATATAPAPAH